MKVAVFDFDGTLYPCETFMLLVNQLKEQQGFGTRYYSFALRYLPIHIKYKLNLVSKFEMRKQTVEMYMRLFKGLTEERIDQFFENIFVKVQGNLNEIVVQELLQAKRDGYYIVLVSGAMKNLLEKLCRDLPLDCIIASELPIRAGRFDPQGNIFYVQGEGKVEKLHEALQGKTVNWQESIAYADSGSDLPVLELVGKPVCVAPDEQLRKIAEERSWRVLE